MPRLNPLLHCPGRDITAQPNRDVIKAALDSVLKSVPDGDDPSAEPSGVLDVVDEAESQAIKAAEEEVVSESEAMPPHGLDSDSSEERAEPELDLSDMDYVPSGI